MMRQFKIASHVITQRNTESINAYLNEIGRYNILPLDEEVALAHAIKSDDVKVSEKALEKLVSHNLRFVVSVANQYAYTGARLEDLISAGNIGLIKAARLFDVTRGFKFISYAIWHIRQEIIVYLNSNKTVRIPSNVNSTIQKYAELNKMHLQIEGWEIPDEVAAAKLELNEPSIKKIKSLMYPTKSIDEKLDAQFENTISDLMVSESVTDSELEKQDLSTDVHRALNILSETEQTVIKSLFGIGCTETTMEEVAETLGMTRERVRQIRNTAVKKMRDSSASLLKKYVA